MDAVGNPSNVRDEQSRGPCTRRRFGVGLELGPTGESLFAREHDADRMIFWLGKASDAGQDLHSVMHEDPALAIYAKDPRVLLIIENAAQLHARSVASSAKPPSLGSEAASH